MGAVADENEDEMMGQPPRVIDSYSQRLQERPFQPHLLLPSGHIQTVFASQRRRTFAYGWTKAGREEVEIEGGVRIEAVSLPQPNPAPALIVLHGMTGSSRSDYMKAFSHKAWRLGWSCFLPSLYNTNFDLKHPVVFHAGASRRVRLVVEGLVERHRLEQVFLAGVSMGANLLLKMLGEWADRPPAWLVASAAASPLCDMTVSWQLMERPSNRIYQIYFTRRLKGLVLERAEHLGAFVDLDKVMQARTIREFDEHFIVPLEGFRDPFHYYGLGSSSPLIDRIRVPTLILHSKDDPFLPWEPLARPQAQSNPNLLIHLTERGGHLGFLERTRRDIDRCWFENRVMEYFQALAESG